MKSVGCALPPRARRLPALVFSLIFTSDLCGAAHLLATSSNHGHAFNNTPQFARLGRNDLIQQIIQTNVRVESKMPNSRPNSGQQSVTRIREESCQIIVARMERSEIREFGPALRFRLRARASADSKPAVARAASEGGALHAGYAPASGERRLTPRRSLRSSARPRPRARLPRCRTR